MKLTVQSLLFLLNLLTSSMLLSSWLIRFIISHLFILHLVHSHCPKEFQCGSLTLSFPFSKEPDCGLILVHCDSNHGFSKITQIQPLGDWTIVSQNKNPTWIIPSSHGRDCNVFDNITLPKNNPAISFSTSLQNVTLLKCDTDRNTYDLAGYRKFSECSKNHFFNIFYNYSNGMLLDIVGNDTPYGCSIIQWPIGNQTFDPKYDQLMFYLLDIGFPLNWNLYGSCKECYLSGHTCKVSLEDYTCSKEGNPILVALVFGTVMFGAIAIICVIIAYYLGKNYLVNPSIFWGTKKLEHENIEKFLKNYGSLGPKSYRYSDIRRMTGSFKVKLGQGGFGSVFKGCLVDGTLVAVKVLNDSKGNGEEFINEVGSISRTSHVNIVKLLGFCFEGNKRALVYEFMPKGSLEKFIFDGKSTSSDYQIGMQELFKIATGVARGLEYLHRLCGTRIVHFDVKPHNVLLDEDFTPKISDFGLAKSCLREQNSILTLSGVRGTVGYIAPEVASRYFGSVSHKSDVYSYGMMVLEIVGGRKNVNNGADNSSQIYMPHWIYNQIETNQNFNFLNAENDEDDEFVRKMIIVSFWCIQTDPLSRPTMTRVVEMLGSKVESLQIPPRPYLFSSASSPFNQSTMTEDGNLNSEIKNGGISDDVTEEPVLLEDMESH